MSGIPPELVGIWLHSHEEDTGSTMVFRPRSYALPPARSRDAVELRADGTCIWHGSGHDDRGEAVPSRWEDIRSKGAQIVIPLASGGLVHYKIQSWGPDRLVVGR